MRVLQSVEPPRWARAILRFVLPCDPMRDAILGDLNEEFVRDTRETSARCARTRYVRSVAEIVTYAVADALRWRSWTSAQLDESPPSRAPGAGLHAGLAAVAVGVLIAGILVNNIAFTAVKNAAPAAGQEVHVSSALGAAAVVLLVACASAAAAVLCAGPRWLYLRFHRGSAS